MAVINTYVDYFKNLAENHPDLNHSDTSGDRTFFAIGIKEALANWREGIRSQAYSMILVLPTFNLNDPGGDARKQLQGGFYICYFHSAGDHEEYLNALHKSEKVGDDIVARMVYDSNEGHPLFQYSLNKIDGIEAIPTENTSDIQYSGMLYSFFISPLFNECIDPNDPGSSIWDDL